MTLLAYVGAANRWDKEIVRGALTVGPFTIQRLDVGRSEHLEIARRHIADQSVRSIVSCDAVTVTIELSHVDERAAGQRQNRPRANLSPYDSRTALTGA